MKYAVLVGDGMSDYPIEELDARTPLEVAETQNMDEIVRKGQLGLAQMIPSKFTPGSDVAILSILGYDPRQYYTGRAPLEAANLGIELGPEDIAFRCNLITVNKGCITDYSGGHISDKEASQLIEKNLPRGKGAQQLVDLMERSYELLSSHDINKARVDRGQNPANMIWLWGQGFAPQMPPFRERFGVGGGVISAVDLVKG